MQSMFILFGTSVLKFFEGAYFWIFYNRSPSIYEFPLITPDILLHPNNSPSTATAPSKSLYMAIVPVSSHHSSTRQHLERIKSCEFPFPCYLLDELCPQDRLIAMTPSLKAPLTDCHFGDILLLQWTPERPQFKNIFTIQGHSCKSTNFSELLNTFEHERQQDSSRLLFEQDQAYSVSARFDQQKLAQKQQSLLKKEFIQTAFHLFSTKENCRESSCRVAFKMPNGRKITTDFHPQDSLHCLYGALYSEGDFENSSQLSTFSLTLPKGPSWSFNDIVTMKNDTLESLGILLASHHSLVIFVEPDFNDLID